MQKLINPTVIATRPEVFSDFQIRKIQNLAKKVTLVSVPEAELMRDKKAPISVLFYENEGKTLRLMRIGQHNILSNKVTVIRSN